MSVLELEALLAPISPDNPCGEDLQYDADFIALESAMQGKPEQQYGETIIPAESPDWKNAKKLALSLVARTKDLRVTCHLARSLVETDGLVGLADGLALTRGYLEQNWDGIHPQLDPEDAMDPTERVNVISSLADRMSSVAQILNAPLVRSNVMGTFSMRNVQEARGEAPIVGDDPPPDAAAIEAAFMDCELESLRDTANGAAQAHEHAVAIESTLTRCVGAANAVSMDSLTDTTALIRDFLQAKLRVREQNSGSSDGTLGEAELESAGASAAGGPAIAGEIRSREDVVRVLDKICDYYERCEPSSPLPMLLRRAKRLATKSFLDILEDMTPDGVTQARLIGGVDSSSKSYDDD